MCSRIVPFFKTPILLCVQCFFISLWKLIILYLKCSLKPSIVFLPLISPFLFPYFISVFHVGGCLQIWLSSAVKQWHSDWTFYKFYWLRYSLKNDGSWQLSLGNLWILHVFSLKSFNFSIEEFSRHLLGGYEADCSSQDDWWKKTPRRVWYSNFANDLCFFVFCAFSVFWSYICLVQFLEWVEPSVSGDLKWW